MQKYSTYHKYLQLNNSVNIAKNVCPIRHLMNDQNKPIIMWIHVFKHLFGCLCKAFLFVAVIVARYAVKKIFLTGFIDNLQDTHTPAWFHSFATFRWVGTCVDFTMATVIGIVILLALALPNEGRLYILMDTLLLDKIAEILFVNYFFSKCLWIPIEMLSKILSFLNMSC